MFDQTQLVDDNVVRVAASLFPAEVQIDSAGATGCRVMVMADKDGNSYVGVWAQNPVGGVPTTVLVEPVAQFYVYESSKIHMRLADNRQVVVTPGRGCSSCGGAASLRNYNPFGPTVSLARVPAPAV